MRDRPAGVFVSVRAQRSAASAAIALSSLFGSMTASELPTRCTPLTERSPDGALYWRGPLPKGRSTEEVFQRRGALLTERSIDGALRKAPTKRSIDGALTLPTKPSTDVALCGRGTLLAKYPVYRRRTLVMGNSPDGALYGRSTLPTEHSLPTKLRSLSTNKALYWQVLALPTELSTCLLYTSPSPRD